MSEQTTRRTSRWDRRIPCVVFMWTNDARPIAVGYTSTYREAKRIERKVRGFHADVGIVEPWNWPLRSHKPPAPTEARATRGEGS